MIERRQVKYLDAVFNSRPYIESIATTSLCDRGGIKAYLPAHGKLPNLGTLTTAGAHSLGVGFRPPRCGNSYIGPKGAKVRQRVRGQRDEAEQLVAQMVF